MESIIQKEKICFLCGCTRDLEKHHVWHGVNRKNAEKDGLTVWLCILCHRNLHDKGFNDKTLMEVGERAWLRETGGSIEDFIRRYGKNVI